MYKRARRNARSFAEAIRMPGNPDWDGQLDVTFNEMLKVISTNTIWRVRPAITCRGWRLSESANSGPAIELF